MFRVLLVTISIMFGALALTLPGEAPRAPDGAAVPAAPARVAARPVPLYTAPMADAALARRLAPGGRVELIGAASDGWVEVRLVDGATGFVRRDRLTGLPD